MIPSRRAVGSVAGQWSEDRKWGAAFALGRSPRKVCGDCRLVSGTSGGEWSGQRSPVAGGVRSGVSDDEWAWLRPRSVVGGFPAAGGRGTRLPVRSAGGIGVEGDEQGAE